MENENILFFDLETTGLPKKSGQSPKQVDNWPRIVQFGCIMHSADGNQRVIDKIVKPVGYTIPKEVSAIHGVTQEKAEKEGILISELLKEVNSLLEEFPCLVAHNINFDSNVLSSEMYRHGILPKLRGKKLKKICTMKASTNFCALPKKFMRHREYGDKFKWPKLEELYKKLFDKSIEGAHNALVDVSATAECFFELKKRGIIH